MFNRTVRDRFEVIEPHIRDRRVLDVGCVDARPARQQSSSRIGHKPDMLFRRIVAVNPQTVGVDVDEEGVKALAAMGYSVICADAQTMDLGRRFDTIVAGEIIEHLENPGLFLRNAARHLDGGGTLIVSTPNPFYQGQTWKIWRYGRPEVHEDHTNWQDPTTLTALLRRCGFEIADGCWVQPRKSLFKTWKRLLRPYFSYAFVVVARWKGA